jgi:cytochrome c biogenesis protein CcmG, thiol:disulfide interchange protein DsbE
MTHPPRLPKPLRIGLIIGLLAVFSLSLFPKSMLSQLPVIRFVRDPDPAPEFKVKDLDGNDLSLASSRGKVVLLNFWATWCGPCRAEIPSLIALQQRYKDQIQIIGLDVDDDDEKAVRGFATDEGINYPIALTPNKVRLDYGGIAALPTLFVINSEGKVVQKHVGLFNPALYEIEVRALLNLPVAAKVETFDDTGEIFLKHADRATMLPGVDTSGLNPDQRNAALHKFNAESCSCGCKFTLAQCRIYDPACQMSKDRTAAIVKEVSSPQEKASPAAAPPANPQAPATPASSDSAASPAPAAAPKP